MVVHPQARPLAKSRRVGPHRWPPTPRSTRLLAKGHPHLARPSKESPGCCWWVEPSKYHAYWRRAAAEVTTTSTWVMLVSGVCAICGGDISRKFQVRGKKGQHFRTARPCPKFGKKGQNGAVQNCCPLFGDPKVTFWDSVKSVFLSVVPFSQKRTTCDSIRSGASSGAAADPCAPSDGTAAAATPGGCGVVDNSSPVVEVGNGLTATTQTVHFENGTPVTVKVVKTAAGRGFGK